MLDELGCDPIEGMARIGMNATSLADSMFADDMDRLQELDIDDDVVDLVQNLLKNAYKQRLDHWFLAHQCFKEVAQYIAPKRKAVEVNDSGDGGGGDYKGDAVVRKMALAVVQGSKVRKQSPGAVKPKTAAKKR